MEYIFTTVVVLGALCPLCLCQVTIFVNNRNVSVSHEKLLTRRLVENYEVAGRGGRPVLDMADITTVHFGLGLIQMDLDEKNNVLLTSMWSKMTWVDQYLTWDPAEFGGVGIIRLDPSQIWLPDVMLLNTADPKMEARNVPVTVHSDGTISWVPQQIFKSSCSVDVAQFPFDHQECKLYFGSWTHSKHELNLSLYNREGIDLSTFTEGYRNGCEWDITAATAQQVEEDGGFTVIEINLNMSRKLVFSSYILTLPCVFLAFLTLVVFCLPPERPDRTGLAMSLFSSFLVLLLILVEAAPPTASSIPRLGLYYCFNMVIIMLSVFLSSLVVHVNRQGSNEPPQWMKLILLKFLGSVLLLQPCCDKCSSKFRHIPASPDDPDTLQLLNTHTSGLDSAPSAPLAPSVCGMERHLARVERLLVQVLQHVSRMASHHECTRRESGKHDAITQQWKAIGRVLDRLFVVIYLFCIVFSLRVLFPVPPFEYLFGKHHQH